MSLRIFGEPDRRYTSRTLDKTAANRLFLRCTTACDVDRATAAAAAARGARDRGRSVRPNWRSDPFPPSIFPSALISLANRRHYLRNVRPLYSLRNRAILISKTIVFVGAIRDNITARDVAISFFREIRISLVAREQGLIRRERVTR